MSKAVVLDSSGNISGINSLSSTSLTGTLLTGSQPNITSLGVLSSLSTASISLNGTTITSTATEINKLSGLTATTAQLNYLSGVTAGTATASKGLVLDSSKNIAGINSLCSTSIAGTIQTAFQPNIKSLGTLSALSTASLTLNGTAITSTATEINKLSGLTATTAQLNYLTVTPGTATASKALVLDASGNIAGITFLSCTSISGTISTASQPNITSLGTLSGLSTASLTLNGTAITSSATEINKLSGLTATTSQLNYLSGVTAGTATASKALVLDSSKNINGINGMTITSYTYSSSVGKAQYVGNWFGTYWGIGPDAGNNDSTLRIGVCSDSIGTWSGSYGNLKLGKLTTATDVNVGGSIYMNTGQILINSVVMQSTASELNYVSGVTPGTATTYKALVTDSNNNVSGTYNITSSYLCTNGYFMSNSSTGTAKYVGSWNQ